MDFWQIALWVLIVILLALYLVIIPLARRGAIRRQGQAIADMQSSIAIGDTIVLIDGITGTVTATDAVALTIRIAPNVEVKVRRTGVAGVEKEKVADAK